jgi:hypothetical protein
MFHSPDPGFISQTASKASAGAAMAMNSKKQTAVAKNPRFFIATLGMIRLPSL